MPERDLDGQAVDLLVDLRWDDYNTALFVEKLFRHVRRGELRFDLEARSGSVETTFAVSTAPGTTVAVVEGVARYLFERVNRADRNLPHPAVELIDDEAPQSVTVRTQEDVREIVERAHAMVHDEDQRDLDDFSRGMGGER